MILEDQKSWSGLTNLVSRKNVFFHLTRTLRDTL